MLRSSIPASKSVYTARLYQTTSKLIILQHRQKAKNKTTTTTKLAHKTTANQKQKKKNSNPCTHKKQEQNQPIYRYGWKKTWQKTGTAGTAQIKEEQTKTNKNLQIRLEDR